MSAGTGSFHQFCPECIPPIKRILLPADAANSPVRTEDKEPIGTNVALIIDRLPQGTEPDGGGGDAKQQELPLPGYSFLQDVNITSPVNRIQTVNFINCFMIECFNGFIRTCYIGIIKISPSLLPFDPLID